MRQPFSLTYVTYETGDRIGELCALLSLAPPLIVVAYATLLVARRDAHLFYIFLGQVVNLALNASLKATLNQPRPPGCDHPGPGMPSDHSQFMGFWACYSVLFLAFFVPRLGRVGWRPALALGMIVLSVAVAASRVYLGYHTLMQVVAGLSTGCVFAAIWFCVYTAVLRRWLGPWVLGSAVCQYFMIRDCAHIEDLVTFEYEAIMSKLRKA